MLVQIDGQFADTPTLPVSDGAFLFGDTLFETLLARGTHIRFLRDHLDRLDLSARLLAFPFDRALTEASLRAVAARLETPASRLRLTITRGPFDGLSLPPPERARQIVTALPFTEPADEVRAAGTICIFAPNQRVNPLSHLPQMKRGNYADCLYAADAARGRGAGEALFVTEDGRVLEGATSNLFVVRDGRLITPPAGELVLAGIMRRQVLRAAARLDLHAEERGVMQDDLFTAEEAFLTNSLIGLFPITAVQGRPLRRGRVWRALFAEIESMAELA